MEEKIEFSSLVPSSFLEMRQHGEKWKTFYLNDDKKVSIGRNPTSDIFVASNNISRTHAILTKEGSRWVIKDNKSLNGVYVNEVRLPPDEWRALECSDVLHLGPPREMELSIKFVDGTVKNRSQEETTLGPRAPKIARKEGTLEVAPSKEQDEVKTGELEKKLQVLEDQLREKERVELELQEKLSKQELELKQNVQERDRLLLEKDQEELVLRQSLEKMLEEKERLLRETMANQKEEQQKMHSETESKAGSLEQELAEVERLRERAQADVVGLMETELTCAICTEFFVEAVTLSCAHTFCRQCIAQWKKKKKECPVCRAKVKGNETRALSIDNFIDGMVKHLDPEVRERRQTLLKERAPGGSKITHTVPTFANNANVNAMSILRPMQYNPSVVGNQAFIVSRVPTDPFSNIALPRPGNLVGQNRMPPPRTLAPNFFLHQQRWPATVGGNPNLVSGQRLPRMGAPHLTNTPVVLLPGVRYALTPGVTAITSSQVSAAVSAASRLVPVSTAVPSSTSFTLRYSGTRTQPTVVASSASSGTRTQPTVVASSASSGTRTQPTVVTSSTVQYSGARTQPTIVASSTVQYPGARTQPTIVASSVQYSVGRTQPTVASSSSCSLPYSGMRTRQSVTHATIPIPTAQVPSTSVSNRATQPSTSPIVVSDSPVRDVSTIVISDEENEDSTVEGNGGYGRCFKCNRRGHWSNGCPFDT